MKSQADACSPQS